MMKPTSSRQGRRLLRALLIHGLINLDGDCSVAVTQYGMLRAEMFIAGVLVLYACRVQRGSGMLGGGFAHYPV
jgi:hypothetical protein